MGTLKDQFHLFLLGREAHLGRDLDPPKPRPSYPKGEKKARALLDSRAVPEPLTETSQDINLDTDRSSETWQDMRTIRGTYSETVDSEVIAVSEYQVSYEDLQRQLGEMKQLLEKK